MEKAKPDSGSPVCVLEDFLRTAESDSSSTTESPLFDSQTQKHPKPPSGLHGFVKLLRSRSRRVTWHPLGVLKQSMGRCSGMSDNCTMSPNVFLDSNLCGFRSPWKNYTLSELLLATNNFSHENLIGKGGYAEVYKGCSKGGQFLAVKRLTRGTPDEMIGDFLSELGIMAHVNHPNTAKLLGYGVEGGMHLVLELSPYGSLASILYGSSVKLEWIVRFKIALGTAKGLLYLHEGCQRRIIHRDIKAANILLTENFEPQICDFGLAKWLPEQWTHHTVSKFDGTFGYLAPEFLVHGIVDEKTDVFAFGVLLLELVTGRRALDYSQQSLVLWAKPLLKKSHIKGLVDSSLGDQYDCRQMNLVLLAASLCIQQSAIRRPHMSQVLELLSGNLGCLKSMKKCLMRYFQKVFRDELNNIEEYESADNETRLINAPNGRLQNSQPHPSHGVSIGIEEDSLFNSMVQTGSAYST